MTKILRFLAVVIHALIDVEEKSDASYMTVYEAQDKFDNGSISMRAYNEVFEGNDVI